MCNKNQKLQQNNNTGLMATASHCVVAALQQVLWAASDDGRINDGNLLTTLIE